MALTIIDVSYHNGAINWEKAKAAGIDGAILRCGYGDNVKSQDDTQWKKNADECTRLGIPFGTYIYSYAKTLAQAKSEAQHVLRLIRGYKLSYPVFYDLEEPGTKSGSVDRMKAFAKIIEEAGCICGVYCNKSWWDTELHVLGNRYPLWIARYNKVLGMENVDIWQHSDAGKIDGIQGKVDMNHCYRDFPSEIKGAGNGEKKEGTGEKNGGPSGGILPLVFATLQGKYGEGETRKKLLGNRYKEVQELINHVASVSISVLVKETKEGKYGNGNTRKTILGNRYDEVQKRINQTVTQKKSSAVYYIVKKGDTLLEIAKKYNTTARKITELNKISNPNKIYAGQKLRIK